jgi:N-methylhydantoinase A
VNYGVDSIGVVPALRETAWSGGAADPPRTERPAWCPRARAMIPTPIYDGPALAANTRIDGPAIIEHPGTTIVVLTGQLATIDRHRHTHVDLAD